MAKITQVRGALLEEAILFLLRNIGYQTYDATALLPHQKEHLRGGKSGLEVRGRGTWHQLDAFALWTHSPPFMYPLNLMVEAKCYAASRPVGVEVPRNSVGVLKDIGENYFTYSRQQSSFRGPRFNHTAAVFSTSGFTSGAIEYAIAHQIFLIQYKNVPAIQPLIDAIFEFDEQCIRGPSRRAVFAARSHLRKLLSQGAPLADPAELTAEGRGLLAHAAARCREIRGSYFGMLQGQWPLHLLRREPLPAAAFEEDIVRCRIHGNQRGEWKFVPRGRDRGDQGWFELEFSLPPLIAELVSANWHDPLLVADLKEAHFSYIDVAGVIGGIRRNVRLQLDRHWIEHYRESLRHPD